MKRIFLFVCCFLLFSMDAFAGWVTIFNPHTGKLDYVVSTNPLTLTGNITLDDNYLSNDGDNEGISVANDGDVTASDNLFVTTYLGVGTTDFDGTPDFGITTIEGASNDGSTYCLIARDSDHANIFELDTDGNATATTFTADAASEAVVEFKDSDCTDSDVNADIKANATATGSGAEVVDIYIRAQGAAGTAGTLNNALFWDGSNETWQFTGRQAVSYETVTAGDGTNTVAYDASYTSHYITTDDDTDGADVLTVSDGTITGQRITIQLKTDGGDDLEVTPTNFVNGTKITLDTAGESCTLEWDGANWFIVSHYGGTVS